VEAINRIYTLVEDVKELDPSLKINLKQLIKKKYPAFRFQGEVEVETVSRGLLVTRTGYEQKQMALRDIIEIQVPINSRDIGKALEKGDLRENAEYKAAMEKQDLLNASASKLQSELQEALIFDESQIDTSVVSFGTKVSLQNLKDQSVEHFTILGPWESKPSENIISYLSPLGSKLCNHGPGEELSFSINNKPFHYRVDSIIKVSLSGK
jgi:transcription elongation GreA/GreB family factor